MSERFWLFDPRSGRFITNALTAELQQFVRLDFKLDPQKKQIRVSFFVGPCLSSFEIYRIQNGHLLLMASEIYEPKELGRCIVEKRKRINGTLKADPGKRGATSGDVLA